MRWRYFDWVLIGCLAILAIIGGVTLASLNDELLERQVIWYSLATIVLFAGSFLNWRWLISQAWLRHGVYWGSLCLLFLTNLQSETIRGTKSWIVVGGFQFEPVEIAKIGLIFMLAGFFSRRHVEAWRMKNISISFVYTAIPTLLTAVHPDFGSAAVMMSVWIGFLLMSGINKKRMLIGLGAGVVLAVMLWMFFLKPYQKDRLTGFLFPERDPLGINYNVIQAKIAIGSAGWLGKGFGGGTQTQLHFLPEAETDFIFAAFVEEWGLLGGMVLILTFLVMLFRISSIGLKARDNSSKFVVLGVGLVVLVHFLINIGSNVGLVPVTGITLPLVSYGGSSILTVALLIGIIESIKVESSP